VRNNNEPANHSGPPTPIDIVVSTAHLGSSSSSTSFSIPTGSDGTWQEDLVMRSTCASNVYFVRAVLLETGGDTDAAVEYIIALSSDGQLDETFQNEFAYEHGIFPEGGFQVETDFDPALLRFAADVPDYELDDSEFHSTSSSHSASSSSHSKHDTAKKAGKQKKRDASPHKPSAAAPHPKLEKF
jgi:hypothetical protein